MTSFSSLMAFLEAAAQARAEAILISRCCLAALASVASISPWWRFSEGSRVWATFRFACALTSDSRASERALGVVATAAWRSASATAWRYSPAGASPSLPRRLAAACSATTSALSPLIASSSSASQVPLASVWTRSIARSAGSSTDLARSTRRPWTSSAITLLRGSSLSSPWTRASPERRPKMAASSSPSHPPVRCHRRPFPLPSPSSIPFVFSFPYRPSIQLRDNFWCSSSSDFGSLNHSPVRSQCAARCSGMRLTCSVTSFSISVACDFHHCSFARCSSSSS